jgi:hypothetical protein
LSLPKDALKVSSFIAYDPLPAFADARAKTSALAAIRFFDRLRYATILFRDDEGVARIEVAMNQIAESTHQSVWHYDGNVLTAAHSVQHVEMKEKIGRSRVPSELVRAKVTSRYFTRKLLLRENAMRSFIARTTSVKSIGSISVLGKPCTILQSKEKGRHINLVVRNSDGALVEVTTKNFEPNGRIATRSLIAMTYENLGKPRASISKPKIPAEYAMVR